jgi:hypothetical protein
MFCNNTTENAIVLMQPQISTQEPLAPMSFQAIIDFGKTIFGTSM